MTRSARSGQVQVVVHAHPNARVERVQLLSDETLDVRVRAPAVEGRANAAVLEALAAALELRPWQVRLVRGERSRQKLVEIDLPSLDELLRRMSRHDFRAESSR